MDIRRQMQRDNLIDVDATKDVISSSNNSRPKLVPLVANYSREQVASIAPIPVKVPKGTVGGGISLANGRNENFPALSTPSPALSTGSGRNSAAISKETEEDALRRSRLELADLAIAKQRARQQNLTVGAIAPPVVSNIIAPLKPETAASKLPPTPPVEVLSKSEEEKLEAERVLEEKNRAKEEKKRECMLYLYVVCCML